MKITVDGLERERDFYYGKLRDIEVLCQEQEMNEETKPFIDQVLEILYATEVCCLVAFVFHRKVNIFFLLKLFFQKSLFSCIFFYVNYLTFILE